MKVSTLFSALFTGLVVAAPGAPAPAGGYPPTAVCSALYGNPLCCRTDFVDTLNLDCTNPPWPFWNGEQFIEVCGKVDKVAKCCILDIADEGLGCIDVVP